MSSWFAHSHPDLPRERWHTLRDHLTSVGEQAAKASQKFDADEIGRVAGLLHDLGKYSARFQARLEGDGQRVDHSSAGAKIAAQRYLVGKHPVGRLIAAAIAGHHAGLANGKGSGVRSALEDRLALSFGSDLPTLDDAWKTEIALPERLRPPRFRRHPVRGTAEKRGGFQLAFLARMLFSCLVDADYLDTEAWFARAEGAPPLRGDWPPLAELKAALDRYLVGVQQKADLTTVNAARAQILNAARGAADLEPGLFSLTVPTGGGKTLSGLAFALDHAVRWQLDRVIYVAPFTSVIEQNAAAFRTALAPFENAVIEHHSAFRDDHLLWERRGDRGERGPEASEKLKLAMEN